MQSPLMSYRRSFDQRKAFVQLVGRQNGGRGAPRNDILPEHVSEAIQYRTFDRTLWI